MYIIRPLGDYYAQANARATVAIEETDKNATRREG